MANSENNYSIHASPRNLLTFPIDFDILSNYVYNNWYVEKTIKSLSHVLIKLLFIQMTVYCQKIGPTVSQFVSA
jgi:hypothetical protein